MWLEAIALTPVQLTTIFIILVSFIALIYANVRKITTLWLSLPYISWAFHTLIFYICLNAHHLGYIEGLNDLGMNEWSSAVRLHGFLSFAIQALLSRWGLRRALHGK